MQRRRERPVLRQRRSSLMRAPAVHTILPSLRLSAVDSGSKCVAIGFACTDAQRMVERGDENLSVADLPGPRSGRNSLDAPVHLLPRPTNFNATLCHELT